MAIPKVAVVLLSYNGVELLEKLILKTLEAIDKQEGAELIVVNNGSTDSTTSFLSNTYPHLKTLTISENKGFTNGFVASLSQIEAEYYVLLSADVEVTSGFLKAPVALFDSDKSIAAIQPKVLSYYNRDEFEYAGGSGGFIDHLGYPFCRGRILTNIEKDHLQYEDTREVFWASGCCYFVRASDYHTAGGLDNDFFAHMEEIDLCWRFNDMGKKVMVCPDSVVYHMGGHSISYGSFGKVFRNHRNSLIMLHKNLPSSRAFGVIFFRLVLDAATFWHMNINGEFKASWGIAKAHWSYFWGLKKWGKKRKQVSKIRVKHTTKGVYQKSIAWASMIKGIKIFKELNWDGN